MLHFLAVSIANCPNLTRFLIKKHIFYWFCLYIVSATVRYVFSAFTLKAFRNCLQFWNFVWEQTPTVFTLNFFEKRPFAYIISKTFWRMNSDSIFEVPKPLFAIIIKTLHLILLKIHNIVKYKPLLLLDSNLMYFIPNSFPVNKSQKKVNRKQNPAVSKHNSIEKMYRRQSQPVSVHNSLEKVIESWKVIIYLFCLNRSMYLILLNFCYEDRKEPQRLGTKRREQLAWGASRCSKGAPSL